MKNITRFCLKIFAVFIVFSAAESIAQTNPTTGTLPYSFNGAASLPGTMAVHKFGAIPATRTTGDGTADLPAGSATSGGYAMEGTGGADGISMLASGTQAAGAIVAEVATTGLGSITVSWVSWTVLNQASYTNSIALQYRAGDSGTWINVDNPSSSVYTTGTVGRANGVSYTQTLPVGANNAAVVQIRWVYWISAGSSGSRDRLGIDNISVTGSPLASVDFANIQFPTTSQAITEGQSLTVYARAYEAGVTDPAGSDPSLSAWIGYSSTNDDPSNPGWTWIPATFNVQVGNDDEYQAALSGLVPGTYYYASRFQIGSGPYVYGGTSGTVWNNNSVQLTVNPNLVNFANVQFPATANINQGGSATIYAQVYDPGVTEAAGQGAGISGWIGYSSTNDNPANPGWTWVAATFNTQSGNNDEYQANIGSGLSPGTYYYASRFQKTGSAAYRYGGLGGNWNNDNGVLTIDGPEMDVTGNSVSIADGDTTPGAGDHTDFGSVLTVGQTVVRTFTIQNTGTTTLTLGSNAVSITGSSTFTVTQQPATTVAAAGSTTFQVTFDPTAAGAGNATVNIANDDFDENPYNFSVTGTGVLPDFVSLTAFNTPAAENFDSMGNTQAATIPVGYGVQNGDTAAIATTTSEQASSGSPSAGAAYNWGQSTSERALGLMYSGGYSGKSIIVKVRNNTGSSVSNIGIAFTYEQYRQNTATQTFKLQYSTSLTSGWTDVAGGGFTNMVSPAGGSAYNFTTLIASQNVNINYAPSSAVANGSDVYFRWILNGTTSSAGVGVDNISIQACQAPTLGVSADQAICAGTAPANMTVSGAGSGTIQWQISPDNNAFTNIGGQTTATLSGAAVGNLTSTRYFRAVVTTSGCGAYNSPVITVSVDPAAVGGSVSGSTTVCGTSNGGTLTLSGQTGSVVQWESSTDNFATAPTVISNATTTLNYSNIMATTYFRALVQSGSCQAYSSVATIGIGTTTTWNGVSWSNGDPDSSKAVVFAADYEFASQLFFDDNLQACSVTVTNNAVVTVNNQYDLVVNGSVAVDSGSTLIFHNNANLIQQQEAANSGNIQLYRLSSALMRLDYTLWSSPVAGQNLLVFSPNTFATRFYTYNTTTNLYNNVVPASNNFTVGKGYLIRMPDDHPDSPTNWTGEFIGTPHNGTVNVTLANVAAGQRFNLVGNPYPSPINLAEFVSDNSANITGTLYFWRKTNNASSPSYCSWSTGGFVPNGEAEVFDPLDVLQIGQGFIVEASASGTSLEFNNSQRIGDNSGQFFRMQQSEKHRIWLKATNEAGAYSGMLVGYYEGATAGVDYGLDGKYMNDGQIALNSVIDGADYVIQGRPAPFDASDIVPLSFKAANAGTYSIAIDHVDGLFLDGQDIFLRDNLTGTDHDLNAGAYTFASEAGTFAARFELLYENALAVNDPDFTADSIVLYNQNGQLVINSGSTVMEHVEVFDMRGRLMVARSGINASQVAIDAGSANGVLIVKITSSQNTTVTKKAVN
jgi:hypothetical protein